MSDQTARLVQRLRTRLRRAMQRMSWAELAFGSAVAVGSVAALWLVAAGLVMPLWLRAVGMPAPVPAPCPAA